MQIKISKCKWQVQLALGMVQMATAICPCALQNSAFEGVDVGLFEGAGLGGLRGFNATI